MPQALLAFMYEVEGNLLLTCNYLHYTDDVTARVLQVVKNMLLRIKYETKLKLEASVKLIIPFIVVVHIAIVVLLLSLLLADAAALDSVTDVARRLSFLASCTRQCTRVLYWRVPSILKFMR